MTEQITESEKIRLINKWNDVLESKSAPKIEDRHRKYVTAQLLENQKKHNRYLFGETLNEENPIQTTTPIAKWDPVLISMVRRSTPVLLPFDLAGVQPMKGPSGLIFAIRAYTGTAQNPADEILVNEPNTGYTGATTDAVGDVENDPFATLYTTGRGLATAAGEVDITPTVTIKIDKIAATAKTRHLRGSYSIETAQDMEAVHGLSADAELTTFMASELTAEMNREFVRTLYIVAKLGAQGTTTPGTYDVTADNAGRWEVERFKNLNLAIDKEANIIARETRRGVGNKLIVTPDVASALFLAGQLDTAGPTDLNREIDPVTVQNPFIGRLNGKYDVYLDIYNISSDAVIVGYRGATATDAGIFFAPYIPFEIYRATDSRSMAPVVAYKTRYALVSNPFVESAPGVPDGENLTPGVNQYYRKFKVVGI